MRSWPAPPRVPSNEPPGEADVAQARAIADLLARLIDDCDARLTTLAVQAAHAAADGAPRAARLLHATSLEVRSDLEKLHTMHQRLLQRFSHAREPTGTTRLVDTVGVNAAPTIPRT